LNKFSNGIWDRLRDRLKINLSHYGNHPKKFETFSILVAYIFAYINQHEVKIENPMGHVGQVFLS